MKFLISICMIAVVAPLFARPVLTVDEIVERARATVGVEPALNGLVTIQMIGVIDSADSKMPDATLAIISRKPSSQRLEVKMDDLVETTILNGKIGCVIRSNLTDEAKRSQMRSMTDEELQRAAYSTRQFFSFYTADFKRGETITYEGIEQRRGVRCHKLHYAYRNGITTTRYFSVYDDVLVSTVTDKGVESVEVGEQIISGIKFPQKVEYYQNNEMLHTIVLVDVSVNKPLAKSIFTIPTRQSAK